VRVSDIIITFMAKFVCPKCGETVIDDDVPVWGAEESINGTGCCDITCSKCGWTAECWSGWNAWQYDTEEQ